MRLWCLGLLSGLMLITGPIQQAVANLGDSLREAKARAPVYMERYGAIEPIFETSSDGTVIMECWAAPAKPWTKAQAYEFGKELLPSALHNTKPRAMPTDGTLESFEYEDGTLLILQGLNGMYFGVEVAGKEYQGPRC